MDDTVNYSYMEKQNRLYTLCVALKFAILLPGSYLHLHLQLTSTISQDSWRRKSSASTL